METKPRLGSGRRGAPAKVAEAIADTVETIAKESAKVAKPARAATARRAKREPAQKAAAPDGSSTRPPLANPQTAPQDCRGAPEKIET